MATRKHQKGGRAATAVGNGSPSSEAEERYRYLAQASETLAESLDYERTLARVAELAVPRLADWAAVDILNTDGTLKRLAVAHVDPSKVELAHELERRYPPNLDDPVGLPNVLRTGRSEFYPEITDEVLEAVAHDAEHLRITRELGLKSGLIVPLVARGRTLGAITFVMAESGRRYVEDDLSFAEDLARRGAVAVDNARLVREAQEAAAARDEAMKGLQASETRLRAIMDSVPGVVWEAWGQPDEEAQRIDFVSDYVERMLGYTVEEWLSTPNFWLRIVHEDDRERAAREARAKFESLTPGTSEFRWVAKDGRIVHVEAHSGPILDAAGQPIGMRGVTMDISKRKRAEAARHAIEAQFRTLTDAMPQLVWATDEQGAHFYYNRRWYEYTGLSEEESYGFGFTNALHPDDLERTLADWKRAWSAGEAYEIEYRFRRHDGEYRWFLGRATPVLDPSGSITQWVGTCTDIEEQKQIEALLSRLNEEREQMLEEISTPLVPVLEGVLVMPLIGSLDSVRMQRATHTALEEVRRTGAHTLIIEITGARVVDSHAVANLSNLVAALRLVGAEPLVTGVGAHVAQNLVALGLDLTAMRTHRTLAQALAVLIKRRPAL